MKNIFNTITHKNIRDGIFVKKKIQRLYSFFQCVITIEVVNYVNGIFIGKLCNGKESVSEGKGQAMQ